MDLVVIYDSATGNTKTCAEFICKGMEKTEGVTAKAFSIDEIDTDYVKKCAALVFGSPTYVAGPSAKMYTFLEQQAPALNLAGKLGGVFATGQYIHGGEDVAMLTMIGHLMVNGMMVYSGGGSSGRPCIHFGPVAISPDVVSFEELFVTFGQRFAEQAKKLN